MDTVVSNPIYSPQLDTTQNSATKELSSTKRLLCASYIVIILLLFYLLTRKCYEHFRDSPGEFPLHTNEPEYMQPDDSLLSDDIKPEDVVALWDDFSKVKDFEYADGKKLFEDKNTVMKEAPTEHVLWAQTHSSS